MHGRFACRCAGSSHARVGVSFLLLLLLLLLLVVVVVVVVVPDDRSVCC
jgi:hypothetical protein